MKKIIYLLFLAGALSMASCDSFLEEDPKSFTSSSSYYKTEAQALSNVNTLYRTGAPGCISSAGSAYLASNASIDAILTGYFTNSYEGQEAVCMYARQLTRQQNLNTVSGSVKGIWDNCYRAINIANGAIKYIPNIDMAEATAAQLIAEAKFFRAFNYYYLVKTFGAVPLTVEPYESLNNLYLKRTSADTIYNLMESDLKTAVETLPASTFANNHHRISKYIAAMALTNVYLRQNKYKEAADMARIVINSPHKLVTNDNLKLGSAYNKLRTTDDLDEVIYAQEFNAGISTGSWWPTYAFNSSAVSIFGTYSIFERVCGPTNRFLNIYAKDDLRIQPNQFFHWEYTNPNTGKQWSSDVAGCWYYYDEEALLTTGLATKDWNFYRYAEALLSGAEAMAQSEGVTAEAAGCLAQIKARADMHGKTAEQYAAELKNLSKDDFVKECWKERLREFPLEFKIWDDCTRTKMFPEVSETEAGKIDFVPLVGAKNGSDATFTESDLLWPISEDAIQSNPNLTQNPGY
jgi:hypothetical protein